MGKCGWPFCKKNQITIGNCLSQFCSSVDNEVHCKSYFYLSLIIFNWESFIFMSYKDLHRRDTRQWSGQEGGVLFKFLLYKECMRESLAAAERLAVAGCTAIWILHLHFRTPTALLTGTVWPFTSQCKRYTCVWWQRRVVRWRKIDAVHQTWLRDSRKQRRRCS